MRRLPARPLLHKALFDISTMRAEVRGMGTDLTEFDAARLMARIESVEALALRLLDQVEAGRVSAH